jgi:NAD-dependent SIR2 family protein deacetylase
MEDRQSLREAARWIAQADGLLITAGAGMGVDSGLPDFRGREGFWKAYPALGRAQLHFEEIANPESFRARPRLAWGFYGHRLNLYRRTVPHAGFALLREWGSRKPHGAFVFTSNVDGQFQCAGFDPERIVECHGSVHHLQCRTPCCGAIWEADALALEIDESACLAAPPLPACPECGAIARPNILMFGDPHWLPARTWAQERRLETWLQQVGKLVVIELGAGDNIPTVRRMGESLRAPLIRINPAEPELGSATRIGLALGALAGLEQLALLMR